VISTHGDLTVLEPATVGEDDRYPPAWANLCSVRVVEEETPPERVPWARLAEVADQKLAPGNYGSIGWSVTPDGTCDVSDPENWGDPGDPEGPCGGFFPVIHVEGPGRTRLTGVGAGQGILLVDGDLTLGGDFEFYGLIFTRGRLETRGPRNRIWGSVMAGSVSLDSRDPGVAATVQYSSCAITRALLNNPHLTRVRPLERRGWVDMTVARAH
jgi:hypothetical protein